MELEIVSKRENHLLKRIEVNFKATHPNEATPKRDDLRQKLAQELSAKKELIIVDWERSDFGRTVTVGYAKVYRSKEDAMRIERKPILVRMGLMAAEVRVKKEKKVAPPPAKREEAKPAEKAPAKKEEGKPEAKKEEAAKPAEKPKEEKPAPAKKEDAKHEAKKPAKGGK